jgi:hypothetical protein
MKVIARFFSLNMRPGRGCKMKSTEMIFPTYMKAFPTYTERILEE